MFYRSGKHFGYSLQIVTMGNYTIGRVNNFVSLRVAAMLDLLEQHCDESVVAVVDVYDVFFLQPASEALRRFRASGSDVIWSTEKMYSGQDPEEQAFYNAEKAKPDESGAANRGVPYSYLNSGGFIGYASVLRRLVADALTIQQGAAGWRNKTCGVARGRICADQWIFGKLLSGLTGGDGLRRFNVSLDYRRSLFYVATGPDWSYSAASRRIEETRPCIFHMPFIQAPKVNATLHALYAGLFLQQPPVEADLSMCRVRHEWCKQTSYGMRAIMEQLDRNAIAASKGLFKVDSVKDEWARARNERARNASSRTRADAVAVDQDAVARELYNTACENRTWHNEQRHHCHFARQHLEPSFWVEMANLRRNRSRGLFNFIGPGRIYYLNRIPFREATDRALWNDAPYCFEPPSIVPRTTWIVC